MAGELSASRAKLERSTHDVQRQHQEVEARRRYIETILERITTGVVSLDADGPRHDDQQRGRPAARPGRGDDRPAGRRNCSRGRTCEPLRAAPRRATRAGGQDPPAAGDCAGARRPRAAPGRRHHDALRRRRRDRGHGAGLRRHHAADPRAEGRGVARGGPPPGARDQEPADADPAVRRAAGPPLPVRAAAHARSWWRSAPRRSSARSSRSRAWWTSSRSSPGCRRPSRIPTHLPQLLADTLALYVGLFREVKIETVSPPAMPMVRVDPEQIRRVVINLVDNAIEAMDRRGRRGHRGPARRADRVARLIVADNGPGIPAGRARKALHAVLFDQAPRQRPRPRHRPAHHRRARRLDRRAGQRAEGHAVHRSSCRCDAAREARRDAAGDRRDGNRPARTPPDTDCSSR